MKSIFVGCAGWTIPKPLAGRFSGDGTHLQRYAAVFSAVEINSSFHRPHRPETYARWADSVPDDFRFSVKLPKAITHKLRLQRAGAALEAFLGQATRLGPKLGGLLVQLPPSLQWDAALAEKFFAELRELTQCHVVCEPRHITWFSDAANQLLAQYKIARVAADPALIPDAGEPGGWRELAYFRLHGSPRTYYSSYDDQYLQQLSLRLSFSPHAAWCVFDNTALGAATQNALNLLSLLPPS
jgi:uncharacterized protein YecE (DUF72 family)